MDSIFDTSNNPPPHITPVSSFWQGGSHVHTQHIQDMEYHHQYSIAPPTHNITSPPTTPMTPGTQISGGPFPPPPLLPPPSHGRGATVGGLSFQSSVPALSHSSWPPDYRVYALCQEIQNIITKHNGSDDKLVWEQFCVEYFHEMAVMVIEVDFGLGFERYSLHGSLILWYFKSIVESGISRFDLVLGKVASHSYQQQIQRIECREAKQELEYELPHHTKVCSNGQMILEFTTEDKPRIISWLFHIEDHVEMIPRYSRQTPALDLSKNLTCQGLPASTRLILVQLNVKPHPPHKLVPVETNSSNNIWEQTLLPPPHHDIMPDSSSILSHLPVPQSIDNNVSSILPPPPVTMPLTHTAPPPTSPPPHLPTLTLSPPLVKSNGSSYGSTCSIVSSGNNTIGGLVMAAKVISNGVNHHKATGGGESSGVLSKRNELVMVASEPALFSADMVHGFDERKITRVENHTKQVTTNTPPSLSITTPSSTTSEIEATPTSSLTNQNSSLIWINSSFSDWGNSSRHSSLPPPATTIEH